MPDNWLTGIIAAFVIGLLTIMFGWPISAWLAIGWLGALTIRLTATYF